MGLSSVGTILLPQRPNPSPEPCSAPLRAPEALAQSPCRSQPLPGNVFSVCSPGNRPHTFFPVHLSPKQALISPCYLPGEKQVEVGTKLTELKMFRNPSE